VLDSRHRQVRTLRVRCTRESEARRVHTLLEDALRTASLGDEGRLVLVRHVVLGPVALDGATALSLDLEQRLRALVAAAVPFASQRAAAADVVWFPDRETACIECALRLASGVPVSAWFWAAAVPEVARAGPTPAPLRAAFRALAADGLAPSVRLAQQLTAAGRLAVLLDALHESDVPTQLVDAADEAARLRPTTAASGRPTMATLPSDPSLRAFIERVGAGDRRARWLSAVLPVLGMPRTREAGTGASTRTASAQVGHGASEPASMPPERSAAPGPSAPTAVASGTVPPPSAADAPTPLVQQQPMLLEYVDRAPTRAAGLFFVLALLERLGLPELLAVPPEARARPCIANERFDAVGGDAGASDSTRPTLTRPCALDLARRVLMRIAVASFVPHSDPIRAALDREEPAALIASLRVPKSAAIHDVLPTLCDRALTGEHGARWIVAGFALATMRMCQRATGMRLRELVLRPGSVSITPTHVDVFLPLDQVDVRVRRAGLDLDPGYVAWLDRVIQFHYGVEGAA
jgi:hypothetical protein